jgi:hypothetical protein
MSPIPIQMMGGDDSQAVAMVTAAISGAGGGDSHDSVTLSASLTDVLSITGQALASVDPGADRLAFWDDSAGRLTWLTLGTNLSITGTTLNAAGGAGVTDLSYTASTRLLASSTGTDVTLPEVVAGGDSGLMTGAQATKLAGIATAATANATDAALRDRATHTGTQALSTISGLGTGVAAALAETAGSANGLVTVGGALGTPSTGNLANCTGLPWSGVASKPPVVVSDPTGITGATAVSNIVFMSQEDYDALESYDADTLYITPSA